MPERRSLPGLPGDSADGLCLIDHRQRVIAWNKATERLLGHTGRALLDRPCYEVMAGSDGRGHAICRPECALYREISAGGLPHSEEFETVTASGRRLWLRVTAITVPGTRQPRILLVLSDITELKRNAELFAQVIALCTEPGAPGDGDGRSGTDATPGALTSRERQVLRLAAGGFSSSAIGSRLGISLHTVRSHFRHILRKLGAHTRAQAVSHAQASGLM